MSTFSLLVTLTSVVEGDHAYRPGVGIGEMLFCQLEHESPFKVHGNALKVEKRNENEDQIIGHLLDELAEKIAPLLKQGFLKTIKAEIMNERIAATEEM